jgi:D-alanyl-lipoteichoic acid acyltransferase DltB (MBOAT superfamily)
MADKLALHVSTGFYQATQLSCVEAWFLSLSYTLQLYLDFSGYTDMALGISRMFNIDLPINFDSPYKATSIQDFWRRWHVTLGKYIRDFVYVPLGGSRGGVLRTAINLILTFSISGLWHGAAWTFIFWGFFHGVGVAVNMFWHRLQKIRISGLIGWIITFNFVNLGWIFFRAENFTQAFEVIKGMCCVHGLLNESVMSAHGLWDKYVVLLQNLLYESTGKSVFLPVKILSFLMICLFCKNSQELLRGFRSDAKYFIFASVLFLFAFLSIGGYSEFIYFRF